MTLTAASTPRSFGNPAPKPSLETIETSKPNTWLRRIDVQEARALELEAIGEQSRAQRIRECTNPLDERGRTCKLRQCPSCAARTAARYATKAAALIRSMRYPQLLLVSLCSRGLHDLRRTIMEQRRFLSTWRRTRLRTVRSAIGCIEPKLAGGQDCWAPHLHLVADVDALLCLELDVEWRALTNGRGTFSVDFRIFRRNVDPGNPYALARYLSKGTDACPAPGTMAPELLRILWSGTGIRGARLPVQWGRERGRRKQGETTWPGT